MKKEPIIDAFTEIVPESGSLAFPKLLGRFDDIDALQYRQTKNLRIDEHPCEFNSTRINVDRATRKARARHHRKRIQRHLRNER